MERAGAKWKGRGRTQDTWCGKEPGIDTFTCPLGVEGGSGDVLRGEIKEKEKKK